MVTSRYASRYNHRRIARRRVGIFCGGLFIGLALGIAATTLIAGTAPAGDARSRMPEGAHSSHKPRTAGYRLHPGVRCSKGSVLAVYAHPDDGLYFMNPALEQSMMKGDCVTVLQLTAGDNGQGDSRSPSCPPIGRDTYYWVCRDLGEEAAFGEMAYLASRHTHVTTVRPTWNNGYWEDPATHQYVSDYWIASDPRITIMNLALPDGSPNGTGFAATGFQSLWRLYGHQIPAITSLDDIATNPDGYASWTRQSLRAVIADVYLAVWPGRIDVQDLTLPSNDSGGFLGTMSGVTGFLDTPVVADHPDHIIGARFAFQAAHGPRFRKDKRWEMVAFQGYPNAHSPAGFAGVGPNTYSQWDTDKWDAFAAYAPYDQNLPCMSEPSCAAGSSAAQHVYVQLQGEWIRGVWSKGLGF